MKHIKKSVSLRKTFWLQFLRGMLISGSAFLIIPIILVYNYTESDFDLGLYTSIGAIISILVLMLFRRVHKKQVSNIFLYIVAFIVIISSVITMLYPSALTSVILYIVSIALVYCFFNVIAVNKVQNTIKTAVKNNSFVIDMESISEVFLCLGRIFSLSILLFLVLFGRMDYLVCFAVFSALLIIPIIMLTRTKS